MREARPRPAPGATGAGRHFPAGDAGQGPQPSPLPCGSRISNSGDELVLKCRDTRGEASSTNRHRGHSPDARLR